MIEDQRDALMAREFIEGAFDEGAAFVGLLADGSDTRINSGGATFAGTSFGNSRSASGLSAHTTESTSNEISPRCAGM